MSGGPFMGTTMIAPPPTKCFCGGPTFQSAGSIVAESEWMRDEIMNAFTSATNLIYVPERRWVGRLVAGAAISGNERGHHVVVPEPGFLVD